MRNDGATMGPRFALICAAVALGTAFPATPADATVTINITQSGSDVVATANGTLNLAGLTFQGPAGSLPGVGPSDPSISLGGPAVIVDVYSGLNGPAQF